MFFSTVYVTVSQSSMIISVWIHVFKCVSKLQDELSKACNPFQQKEKGGIFGLLHIRGTYEEMDNIIFSLLFIAA